MADLIELWGRKNAYNVLKVLWILDELELPFVHHDVGSSAGDLDSAAFLELNPHARIPVLVEDDAIVWESNTILRYLAARYARETLWSSDPLQRSNAERWMDWELTKLQPDFIHLFWSYYRTPPAQRDNDLIDRARRQCALHFELIDRHLAHQPYLAGATFSMGDMPAAVCLYRYFEMGIDVAEPEFVKQWYRRLAQRSAYRNTIMVAFDELRARLDY